MMVRILTIVFYTLATVGVGTTAYTVISELWAQHKIDTIVIIFALVALASRFGDIILRAWAKED